MSFTYFKFLFINTIKRRPVWITWLLFLFTCTCFIIILPITAKMNTLQLWANTTMAICETFMGMAAALFTAVLAINIFKEGNEEGTELIVVSKPISRLQIIITKFLLFGFICLLVNVTAVIITMFTIFLPRTEVRFYWGLVISMLIGNAVTFGVFGSIAILMSVKFAKVGIIITNIALSLVFLIYQALTIFVFPIPAKALADNYMTAPSYITVNRKDDGSYSEEEFVKFTGAPVTNKDHPCYATNADEMRKFWEKDILGQDPSVLLTATDLAGQISLSYLSYGLDEYADRQANRMFAISRFYNYSLTNSASPEIIGNTKALPWIYTGSMHLDIDVLSETYRIYLPSSFGYCAIPPITVTRLKGYTDQIPVGYVKSKESLSDRDVYFEKDQWKRYCLDIKAGADQSAFDMLYDKVLHYTNYLDLVAVQNIDPTQYGSLFVRNNGTFKRYYELIWHSFMGDDQSVLKKDGNVVYTKQDFDINNPDDLNDRYIQFKYYAAHKAYKEQHDALLKTPQESTYAKPAWENARNELSDIAEALSITYSDAGWMMKANGDSCFVLEPGTQTLSYNLINTAWELEHQALTNAGITDQKDYGVASMKGIMNKTQAVFNSICHPTENFLFNSLELPTRTSKAIGEAFIVKDNWIPYLITQVAPFVAKDYEKLTSMPLGHNMSYFYYKTTPVLNYWIFAIIWGAVALTLFTGGAIIYKKYDFK